MGPCNSLGSSDARKAAAVSVVKSGAAFSFLGPCNSLGSTAVPGAWCLGDNGRRKVARTTVEASGRRRRARHTEDDPELWVSIHEHHNCKGVRDGKPTVPGWRSLRDDGGRKGREGEEPSRERADDGRGEKGRRSIEGLPSSSPPQLWPPPSSFFLQSHRLGRTYAESPPASSLSRSLSIGETVIPRFGVEASIF